MKSIKEFQNYLIMGREIEFSLNQNLYFVQPDYENAEKSEFKLFLCVCNDSAEDTEIFHGTMDDLLEFKFEGRFTLNKNLDLIDIQYIL